MTDTVSLGLLPMGRSLGNLAGGLGVATDESFSWAGRTQGAIDAGANAPGVIVLAALPVVKFGANSVGTARYAMSAATELNASPFLADLALSEGSTIRISGANSSRAGSFDTIPQGQRLILRPVEIEFPAPGLTPEKQTLFAQHLAEQESQLNYLSLSRKEDLMLNLENYQNIKPQLATARKAARGYLEGQGVGMDAAHRLDAVAGGYVYDFVGFRDPVQQRIGSLWRTRTDQIVPGREHRLVPNFNGRK